MEDAFSIPNPTPEEGAEGEEAPAEIPSDTLVTFSIDKATGALTLSQKAAAGGRGPRQFAFNKEGSLVAVALQADSRVAILSRNVKTGDIGGVVAAATVAGGVTAVIFDE